MLVFLSTPSARRATAALVHFAALAVISIHALREEGDVAAGKVERVDFLFLSTPSARRATHAAVRIDRLLRFLSTPSARRATSTRDNPVTVALFLSTPSARRATTTPSGKSVDAKISIHALREEGDCFCCWVYPLMDLFLSTPSARRATTMAMTCRSKEVYFYPRPPRGGRRLTHRSSLLSTPSARRATHGHILVVLLGVISIHALREEGDSGRTSITSVC